MRTQVYYSIANQPNTEKELVIRSGATRSVMIRDLESFVQYRLSVLGYTLLGLGPRSRPVAATTEGSSESVATSCNAARMQNVNEL